MSDVIIIERIDAVFLPVKNLEESLNWYTDIFGFPLRWKKTSWLA